jgi:hypothetical protein
LIAAVEARQHHQQCKGNHKERDRVCRSVLATASVMYAVGSAVGARRCL